MRRAFSKPATGEDLPRLLGGFRAEGYEGLQLKVGQYAPYLDDPEGALAELGDDPGIYSALIYFADLDPEALSRVVRFAERVGSERVVFCHKHPRTGVTDDDIRGFARRLSAAGAEARARGVALSLHHHFEQPVMRLPDFRVFFGAVDDGNVGLTVDTAHLAKSGITDLPAFVDEFAPVIDNVHLKDYDGGWRLLGEGRLDLDGVIAALGRTGYEGWLCVDEESDASLGRGFRASKAWLDEHLPS